MARKASAPATPEPTPLRPPLETPTRSTVDVLAGRLRISLAAKPYWLPVLTIGQNEDWVAQLDAALAPLIKAPDDDLDAIVTALESFNDQLLGFVWSYDVTHVLPPLETIRRDIYPFEVLRAVMEIRAAANPTLGFALASMLEEATRLTSNPSTPNMSSSPTGMAGPSATSAAH